jgi:prepilin peptidase CpaA
MVRELAPLVLLLTLGGLLLAAGIEDARTREIANAKNAAIALLAPLWWWAGGLGLWPEVALQLLAAAIVFAVFVGAFAAGWMGGGDVKMIGALALWLPPQALLSMLTTMSVLGGGVTALMMAERRWRRAGGPDQPAAIEVPYGVAIAAAGLLALREPLFNHLP